jgi:hypothetical protein
VTKGEETPVRMARKAARCPQKRGKREMWEFSGTSLKIAWRTVYEVWNVPVLSSWDFGCYCLRAQGDVRPRWLARGCARGCFSALILHYPRVRFPLKNVPPSSEVFPCIKTHQSVCSPPQRGLQLSLKRVFNRIEDPVKK